MITANATGYLLPPFIILKAAKPKEKSEKDHPDNEFPTFDTEASNAIKRASTVAIHNYSAWCTKWVMEKHSIPYFAQNTGPESVLLMDNFSSHFSDESIKAFETYKIKQLSLAPNTTCTCQPVDDGIGGTIKGKIKQYFNEWILDSLEATEDFVSYDEKKKKHRVKSPSKELIVQWILKAYEEINAETIRKSKLFSFYFS